MSVHAAPAPLANNGDRSASVSFEARPILILFSDDSTLFFARRMRCCLQEADVEQEVHLGWVVGENALSFRQMEQLLPEGPDLAIHGKESFRQLLLEQQYKAVLTSRVFAALGAQLRRPEVSVLSGRPCVLGFLGGLEFFPSQAYYRRRNCDGVYLFPASEIPIYEALASNWGDRMWQEVGFGHPTFVRPEAKPPADLANRRDIYFFTQALSPTTRRGRLHMLAAMAAIARANPDFTVWIKLRHLPHENQRHLHLEKYDYPGLLNDLRDAPENLKLIACTMDEALENAALGITCTSTAAIDVLRANIPCIVHLDFVDNYVDPLVVPMRKIFEESGVITSLEDMLNLRASPPDPNWILDTFCGRDLGARVLQTISRFNERAFQVGVRTDLG